MFDQGWGVVVCVHVVMFMFLFPARMGIEVRKPAYV